MRPATSGRPKTGVSPPGATAGIMPALGWSAIILLAPTIYLWVTDGAGPVTAVRTLAAATGGAAVVEERPYGLILLLWFLCLAVGLPVIGVSMARGWTQRRAVLAGMAVLLGVATMAWGAAGEARWTERYLAGHGYVRCAPLDRSRAGRGGRRSVVAVWTKGADACPAPGR